MAGLLLEGTSYPTLLEGTSYPTLLVVGTSYPTLLLLEAGVAEE